MLTSLWTGKHAPPPLPPSPVFAKILQLFERKNCRETILLWKMRFSVAKIARVHRTRRWARLKLERDEALSSFLGFFDRLSFPPVVGGFCAPQCLACILKKRHPLNTFRGCCGAPGAIRTRGLPLRRRTLYPAELRAHSRLLRKLKTHSYYDTPRGNCQVPHVHFYALSGRLRP